ncbi:ankyrin repeat-containing protein, partial [Ixodes scapularis]
MEVNKAKILEEKLREAACYGDEEAVITLVERNVRINSQHDINGWTPLHWACKRGHVAIVRYLLNQGADPTLTTLKGETPAMLTDNEDIRSLIGGKSHQVVPQTTLPITPHFLSHPALSDYKGDQVQITRNPNSGVRAFAVEEMDLVLKVRVAYLDDPDFIEVELPRTDLTFANLLRTCCDELGAEMKRVRKLRKLPNTIMRKDKEVQRLSDYQELELVLDNIQPKPAPSAAAVQTIPAVTNGAITPVM